MGIQETPSSPDTEQRVVSFRPRAGRPADDLAKYQGDRESPADYRHRMIVNSLAFVFVVGLVVAGLWLADTMATMRKNQDCVLSGRRGCTPVEVQGERW